MAPRYDLGRVVNSSCAGSDDPKLLDLNPAEKKTVKAQKAAQAKANEEKRQGRHPGAPAAN
jgi:hypothetical protein